MEQTSRLADPTFDRRRFPRVGSESLIALAPLADRIALAHAVDVSLGGVRVQCVGLNIQPGELLRVTFTFAQRSVPVVGQCVRVEQLDDIAQDVALRFLKMGDETRGVIQENLNLSRDSSASDERREFVRASVDSIVSVSRANVLDVVGQAQNISAGGIHFIVEGLDVALGDVLRVTIDVDGEPVQVVGQLVRVTDIGDSKQEAALAFLEVPSEVAQRLRQLGQSEPDESFDED
jgi:hypothetical protein